MIYQNTNILTKFISCLLVIALISPTVLKSFHNCEHHEVFVNADQTQVQGLEIDCDFCDLETYLNYLNDLEVFEIIEPQNELKFSISHYESIHSFTLGATYLRGPPSLLS